MLLTILLWNIVVCNAYLENIRITPRKLSWLNAHNAAESIDQQTAEYRSKKVFQNIYSKCRSCHYTARGADNGGKYNSLQGLDRRVLNTFHKQRNDEFRKLPLPLSKSRQRPVNEKHSQGGDRKYTPKVTQNPVYLSMKLKTPMRNPLDVHPSYTYNALSNHEEQDDDDKFDVLKRRLYLLDDKRHKYIETPLLGESNDDYIKTAKINRGNDDDEIRPFRQKQLPPIVFNSFESRWYQQNKQTHADRFAKKANLKRNDYLSVTRQAYPDYNKFQNDRTTSKRNKTVNNQSLQTEIVYSQGTKLKFPNSQAISKDEKYLLKNTNHVTERSTNIPDKTNKALNNYKMRSHDSDNVNSQTTDKLNRQTMKNNIDSRYPIRLDLIGHHLMSNKLYTETYADKMRNELIGTLVNRKAPNSFSGLIKPNNMIISSFRSPDFKSVFKTSSTTLPSTTWKPVVHWKLSVNDKSKIKGARTPIRSMPFSFVGDSQQTHFVPIKHGIPVNPLERKHNSFWSQPSKSPTINIAKGIDGELFFQNDNNLNYKILSSFPIHDIKQKDQRMKQLNTITDPINGRTLGSADIVKSNFMNGETHDNDNISRIKYTGTDGKQSDVIQSRMFSRFTTPSTSADNIEPISIFNKHSDEEAYFYDSGSPIEKKIFMPKNQYDSKKVINKHSSNNPKMNSGLFGFLSKGLPESSLDLKKDRNFHDDLDERKKFLKSTKKNGLLSTDSKNEGSSHIQKVNRFQGNTAPLEKTPSLNTNIKNNNGLNIFQEVKKQTKHLRRIYDDDDNVILKQNNFFNDIRINGRTKSTLGASSNQNRQRIPIKFPVMLRKGRGRLKKDKLSLLLTDQRRRLTDSKNRLELIKSMRRAAKILHEHFLRRKVSNVAKRRPENTRHFSKSLQQNNFPLVVDRSRLYLHRKRFPYLFMVNKRLLVNKK
ncbi:uncharacterized protein [Mytilus edulis]|uniref:uncharacterized protein n=1 Tax=Mytilus edulis TaxID=6550 RepID=UPI0039EFEC27